LAAGFVNQSRIDLIEMIKIKLFFSVLFLFVFQLSFSFTPNANMMDNSLDKQPLFGNISITQNISEGLVKNQFDAEYNNQPSKWFLSNNNSKEFYFSIFRGTILFNSVKPAHLFNFGLSKKEFNVPICLQTEKFRL
jgi:hypothetical protein